MKTTKTTIPEKQKKYQAKAISAKKTEVLLLGRDEATVESPLADKVVEKSPSPGYNSPVRHLSDLPSAVRAEYLDAIKEMVPALANIFVQASPDILQKPLAERSTDELIIQIDAGRFTTEIARIWGIPSSNLSRWIMADAERLARAQLARKNQAALWDWVALQVLLHAPSSRVEIVRAEKIAQHCRWRAEVFNRDDYGQSIKVTQAEERNARELTTQELEIIARGGVLPG